MKISREGGRIDNIDSRNNREREREREERERERERDI